MKFLRLTDVSGDPVYVNMAQVVEFYLIDNGTPAAPYTHLELTNNGAARVQEAPVFIAAKI